LATGLKRGKIEKYFLNDYLGGVKTGKYEKPAYHETQNWGVVNFASLQTPQLLLA
jgi:hypothetical protein